MGTRHLTGIAVSAALLFSSTAAAAANVPVAATSISPWAALSALGTQSSRASLCGASAAAVAAAGASVAAQAPGQPGCVLPVVDAAPVPVAETPPPAVAPPVVAQGGFGISPLYLALGGLALAGLVWLLTRNNGPNSPN